MINFKKKTAESGRSMIEMLGVLAIVGILSAGGIAGYSMSMQSYKTNALIEKVNLIAMQTRKVYKGSYAGMNIQNLLDAGKITDISNPFGGNLKLQTSGWGNTMFHVSIEGSIPPEACTELLQTDWGSSGVFEGVHMIGNSNLTFRYNAGTWPVTTSDAVAACKGGATIFRPVFK